jgi:predicted RNA binding protein YcfA (HicA-like mRNA interferase family)
VKRVSWQELQKLSELAGWVEDRTRGDHRIMVKDGTARPTVIKMDSDLGDDLVQSVKRSLGLTTAEFHSLLDQVRNKKKRKTKKNGAKPKTGTAGAEPSSDLPN